MLIFIFFYIYFFFKTKVSKTGTPPSQAKSTPKPQKISPSKGNSRSPQTPSPSKTGLSQAHSARVAQSSTHPGRGLGHTTRREPDLSSSASSAPDPSSPSLSEEGACLLWVDKYRPRSLKTVIGQQGDQSCANKLTRWLQNWHKSHSGGSSKPAGRRQTTGQLFLFGVNLVLNPFCFLLYSSKV